MGTEIWEWLASLLISLGLAIKWLAGVALSALLGKLFERHLDDDDEEPP